MKPAAHLAGATHPAKSTPTNASGRQRRAAARGELRMNCGNAGKTADRGAGTADKGGETADELRMLDETHSPLSPLPAAAAAVRRSGRAASPAARAGAELAAPDPALPLEPPSVPRREAIPAAPLHSRGDRWPDAAPPSLVHALPVVLDALCDVAPARQQELQDTLAMCVRYGNDRGRARLAELLTVLGLRVIDAARCATRGPALDEVTARPATMPSIAPPAAPWSLNLTRGDAQRWPDVWAQWLPRWTEGAAALGVAHREHTTCDIFSGPRHSLLALGIVRDGDLPGDPGRGRSMVTFAFDGRPKRRGDAVSPPALHVLKSGRRFFVAVFAPADVVDERRLRAPAPLTTVPEVPHAVRPPLRLVRSGGSSVPDAGQPQPGDA